MKELPEPDIQPQEARDMGLEELPYFADKSVLAIQKQAYEDGLRYAANRADSFHGTAQAIAAIGEALKS